MTLFNSAIKQLEQERTRIATRITQLNKAILALTGAPSVDHRRISAAGRARIAAAQRARWAKARAQNSTSVTRASKRKMSAAAIARIRVAQKARWAKWRKQQKAA